MKIVGLKRTSGTNPWKIPDTAKGMRTRPNVGGRKQKDQGEKDELLMGRQKGGKRQKKGPRPFAYLKKDRRVRSTDRSTAAEYGSSVNRREEGDDTGTSLVPASLKRGAETRSVVLLTGPTSLL